MAVALELHFIPLRSELYHESYVSPTQIGSLTDINPIKSQNVKPVERCLWLMPDIIIIGS